MGCHNFFPFFPLTKQSLVRGKGTRFLRNLRNQWQCWLSIEKLPVHMLSFRHMTHALVIIITAKCEICLSGRQNVIPTSNACGLSSESRSFKSTNHCTMQLVGHSHTRTRMLSSLPSFQGMFKASVNPIKTTKHAQHAWHSKQHKVEETGELWCHFALSQFWKKKLPSALLPFLKFSIRSQQ